MGVLGHDIATVQQASSHVLAVPGVTLDHLVVGLEARHGHLLDRVGLVGSLGGRDDGRVGDQREVDTGVWHKVGLELVQVDVQGAIETQGGGDGRDNCDRVSILQLWVLESARQTLSDQAVQVDVVGALEPEVAAANVVDGLVVDHEGAVGVLQGGVGGQDRVVRLNDGDGGLRGRVDAELELALLAVVDGQTLHEESAETRAGTTTERVEDQEALETGAGVGNTADLVEDTVDELLANGVVATSIVVGGILLASDHVLGVEQASVGAGADLVDDVGLEIAVDCSWDILALACVHPVSDRIRGRAWHYVEVSCTCLGEESAEALIRVGGLALVGQVSIGLHRDNASVGAVHNNFGRIRFRRT